MGISFGKSYLVEVDNQGIPTTDMGYTFIQAIKFREWYSQGQHSGLRVYVSTIEDITNIRLIIGTPVSPALTVETVPVGSIEYVEKFVQLAFKVRNFHLKVTNIPKELLKQEYLGRTVWESVDTLQLGLIFSGARERIFVKSISRNKKIADVIYTNEIYALDQSDRYFVSKLIDITAEWRAFIFKGNIISIHQYSGKGYAQVDIQFIEKMIKDYQSAPAAYTLDIALTSCNKHILIESHNFISVGLYGFEDYSKLVQMTIAGYKTELGEIL